MRIEGFNLESLLIKNDKISSVLAHEGLDFSLILNARKGNAFIPKEDDYERYYSQVFFESSFIEPAHKLKIDQNKLQNCRSNILNLVNVL
ncbi:hypothetical protein D1AOALGA4SA_12718 [Olavius algarvensis Delta 1 endosymbiont]|nr:hypothetical protein D1AOALGA4SA_12718 [Olavius algarvensis Delta 1 endosymbiont]